LKCDPIESPLIDTTHARASDQMVAYQHTCSPTRLLDSAARAENDGGRPCDGLLAVQTLSRYILAQRRQQIYIYIYILCQNDHVCAIVQLYVIATISFCIWFGTRIVAHFERCIQSAEDDNVIDDAVDNQTANCIS
jgi:hypothetical protein